MITITEAQRKDLVTRIYNTLISNPEVGLGELGECKDEAERIVSEWVEAHEGFTLADSENLSSELYDGEDECLKDALDFEEDYFS